MKIPNFIKNNLLLKITSLNSIGVSIRITLSLISQKIVAEILGPAGVAQIGNIRDIIPMIESFSTLGVFNGVVKYIAENRDNEKELQKLFSTTFVYSLLASIAAFFILYFGANFLNNLVFPKDNFVFLFKTLSVAVPFIALNRMLNGVINGLSAYKTFVKINLISYISSVVLLLLMVSFQNLNGALIAIALTPILQFSLIGYFYYDTVKGYIKIKKISFKIPYGKELLSFTLMSLVATFLGRFVDICIRENLYNKISEIDAGNWTGMTNISKQYLMFMSAILSLYVIPKFASIKSSIDFKNEVLNIYKTILPIFAFGMLIIYFFREWIILFVKTDEFIGMKPLFKWQLIGDFIKIASMIIAHQFLAKKMVKSFLISEIISLSLFFFLSIYLLPTYGVEGVVIAHFFRHFICFFIIILLIGTFFRKNRKPSSI